MSAMETSKSTNTRPHISLADRLVRTVGFQSAVRACQYNQWHGVLQHLAKNKHYYLTEYAMCGAQR